MSGSGFYGYNFLQWKFLPEKNFCPDEKIENSQLKKIRENIVKISVFCKETCI